MMYMIWFKVWYGIIKYVIYDVIYIIEAGEKDSQ